MNIKMEYDIKKVILVPPSAREAMFARQIASVLCRKLPDVRTQYSYDIFISKNLKDYNRRIAEEKDYVNESLGD